MAHPLVEQLRFARSEFERGLAEVSDPEAQQRFGNMNCISWMVGHLAWLEQRYWLTRAQGQTPLPGLNDQLAYGKPACTPSATEMWAAWRQVVEQVDPWLDTLTTDALLAPLMVGYPSVGTFLLRNIYHTWYHLGEGMAVRQMLGHTGLPEFVGAIEAQTPYRSEAGSREAPPEDKAEFLRMVIETRQRWAAEVAAFSQEQMVEPFAEGDWSLKDAIAHITWHEKEMLGVLRSRVFRGSDLWNEPLEVRNQAIYEQHRNLPLGEVLAEAETVYSQLEAEIERLEDEDLHDPARIAELPPEWRLWDVLASNTFQHYEDHTAALRGWRKGRGAGL